MGWGFFFFLTWQIKKDSNERRRERNKTVQSVFNEPWISMQMRCDRDVLWCVGDESFNQHFWMVPFYYFVISLHFLAFNIFIRSYVCIVYSDSLSKRALNRHKFASASVLNGAAQWKTHAHTHSDHIVGSFNFIQFILNLWTISALSLSFVFFLLFLCY